MNKFLLEDFQEQSNDTKVLEKGIEVLQKAFTFSFPKAYVEFMTAYGAVLFNYPFPNALLVNFYEEKRILSLLSFLEPLEVHQKYLDLREDSYYGGEAVIPSTMIPILDMVGEDDDNYILINLENGSLWTNFFGISVASDKNTFAFVAKNFIEFLDNIDEYDKLYNMIYSKEEIKIEPIPIIHLKSKQTAPKTGRYQATLNKEHPQAEFLKSSGFDVKNVQENQSIGTFGLSEEDEDAIVWVYLGE